MSAALESPTKALQQRQYSVSSKVLFYVNIAHNYLLTVITNVLSLGKAGVEP
jgi:hypothetical protein